MIGSKNSDIKDDAENLLGSVRDNVIDITHEAGVAAKKLGKKVKGKSRSTKAEALTLIESAKAFLASKAVADSATELKEQLAEHILDWKGAIQQELVHATELGKDNTEKIRLSSEKMLKKRTWLTLSAVLGTGILIGYLVGSADSEEEADESQAEE
jgi:ElaB/YqjD/DUF883 family membrane-anchored ribosome-binding protein